jgi:hypothetical protein
MIYGKGRPTQVLQDSKVQYQEIRLGVAALNTRAWLVPIGEMIIKSTSLAFRLNDY